jgi:RNA polymerase sigma-70 factor (ECF subfamily)
MASLDPQELQGQILPLIPNMRAFARSISRNPTLADDLVQESLIKAFQNSDRFAEGSNLKAWLFTIVRTTYLSHLRRRKYEVEDADGKNAEAVHVPEAQSGHMDMIDFVKALDALPPDQREALILVGAEGFSYEDVALMCGCAVGTVKSRVNRARAQLRHALEPELADASISP